MTATSSDWQVWQDPTVAGNFADRRRGGLLGGDAQLDTLGRLLCTSPALQETNAPLVLDLGCGDGILLETTLGAFPEARGVALDGSPAMLDKARQRLAGKNVTFVEADFNDPAWTDKLPQDRAPFQAVISGFAIHHSEDERKRTIYAQIFDLLAPGGVFINTEHVASASPLGEQFFETAYGETLWRFRRGRGEDVSLGAVLDELRARPDKAANRLSPVETQLGWLREIGFVDVDCYWKHFELAVLAGYKPLAGV
jgi:SAM-dependent methyltransferase